MSFTNLQLEQRIIQKLTFNISSKLIQELIFLGFEYSLQNPINLNLEDFKNYFYLSSLLRKNEYIRLNYQFKDIFSVKLNINFLTKIISKKIYQQFFYLINYYKYNTSFFSPLSTMINTGAKANWNQIRQLIGLRGYLVNARGFLFKLPILQNFSKGLKNYEYFISCYGARKGILDTSLKTANAGYLTRRLVDSLQELTIKEYLCGTTNFFTFKLNLDYKGFINLPFYLMLYGKTFQKNIKNNLTGKFLFLQGYFVNKKSLNKLIPLLKFNKHLNLHLNSIKLCLSGRTLCSKCFGFSSFKKTFISQSIGVLVGESIGEPVTQLTLRTFHTGGVLSTSLQSQFFFKNKFLTKSLLYKDKKFKLCSKKKFILTYKLPLLKLINLNFNTNFLMMLILIKKKFNLFKIKLHSILNKDNLNKTIFYFLKFKFLKLFYIKQFSIYTSKFPFYFFLVKYLYQRNFNFSSSFFPIKNKSEFLFAEFLFKKNIQYLTKNNYNQWIILSLHKALMFNKYYSLYKIHKYNRGLYFKTSFNLRFSKFFFKNYKTINITFKKYNNKNYNIFPFLVYINCTFQNKFLILTKKKSNIEIHLIYLFGTYKLFKNITNFFNIEIE